MKPFVKRVLFSLLFLGLAFAQEPAESGSIVVDEGVSIYYESWGEGETVLLVHGFPLSGGLFRDNVAALAASYRVITVDLRGFGDSETPNADANIEVYATDVLSLMTELGIERAIIGGMSMGGPTVFEMYRRAPERFRGMILISTIAEPASPAEAGLWRGMGEMAAADGPEALTDLLMADMLTGRTRMERPELAEYLGSLIAEASVEGTVGGTNALATRPDATDLLPQITVPVLIIVGEEDAVYSFELSQRMHEALPDSELLIVPAAAHAVIIEAAEEANEAILAWAAALD